MTTLFEALAPDAREELIRDHVIEFVSVIVNAVPDPERPEDRLAMKIAADVTDAFAPGICWIDADLACVREICDDAARDIPVPVQDALLVALNRQRKVKDGLLAGKIGGRPVAGLSDPQLMAFLGPIIREAPVEVPVWWMAWTVGMSDDGLMCVDCEDSVVHVGTDAVFVEDGTGETRQNVLVRMRKVNDVVGRMLDRLLGGA